MVQAFGALGEDKYNNVGADWGMLYVMIQRCSMSLSTTADVLTLIISPRLLAVSGKACTQVAD